MLKRVGLAVWLTLAVALTLAACGDDETSTPGTPTTVNVRNGTWSLTFVTSWAGVDSCVARGELTGAFEDTLLCSFDLVGTGGYPFECETVLDGEDVSFECSTLIREIDPCKFIGYIDGTGTVTDTTIELTAQLWVELIGPGELCDFYKNLVDPCVEVVQINGHWVSAEGAEECPEGDVNQSASVLKGLLGRAAATSFEGY